MFLLLLTILCCSFNSGLSSERLFIPIKKRETVRLFCQTSTGSNERPRLSGCSFRSTNVCDLDFNFNSSLPSAITCTSTRGDLRVNVTVIREVFRRERVHSDENTDVLTVTCLVPFGEAPFTRITRDDGSNVVMKWGSSVRQLAYPTDIDLAEHNYQPFFVLEEYRLSKEINSIYCNGTIFRYDDYINGKTYYTDRSYTGHSRVSTVATATTKQGQSNVTTTTTNTTNKKVLGFSKTNLILVIVGIVGLASVIVLVFILLWCRIRRKNMRTLSPNKEIEPVYPIRSLAEPLVSVVPTTPIHTYDYPVELKPQYEVPDQDYLYEVEDDTQLIPPSYRHANLQSQISTNSQQMSENEYSDLQSGRQKPRSVVAPGLYNKLNEGFPSSSTQHGYDKIVKVDPHPYDRLMAPQGNTDTDVEDLRYNVLSRNGKSDEPYRYNVLSRGV